MAQPKKKQLSDLERAYETVANTSAGLMVLRDIYERTGYAGDVLRIGNDGEVMQAATLNNLSKRDVWLHMRRKLSPSLRALIENQED